MAQTINTRIVLRNDSTANWLTSKDVVLLKGEVGIEFLADGKVKMKIGDGTLTWEQLPYFGGSEAHVYEVTPTEGQSHVDAINAAVGTTVLAAGDVAIVKELISGEHYSHTAYVYDGIKASWIAMDGNYNANNVYFSNDLILTQQFGKYVPDSTGSVTVKTATNNLSLAGLFLDAFSEEKNPTASAPSVSFNSIAEGSYEVGTEVTPSYNAKLNAGSYTYGPATGITAKSWDVDVADLSDDNLTASSGSFTKFTVIDGMNKYAKITATASYDQGAMPVTNLGNDYPSVRIAAGSKSKTSNGFTAFRGWFYGYKNGDNKIADPTAITSAQVRALNSDSGKTSFPTSMATTNMQQMFFAAPAGVVDSVSVAHSVNGAPQTVKTATIYVTGKNAYVVPADQATDDNTVNGMKYDLFYVSNDNANSGAATYTITTKLK